MYQPQLYQPQQPRQQQTTVVLQPTGPVQPIGYIVRSSPAVCEFYDGRQSMAAGIILIIAGAFSIIFNILGFVFFEPWTFSGHGFWCGVMVSWSLTVIFVCGNCTLHAAER